MKALARSLRSHTRPDAAWVAECLNRADAILAAPPARPHIVRVGPVGALVARFVLPLELCPTLNRFAEMESYRRKRIKDQAALLMLVQGTRRRLREPLGGRPFVRAVRFSSTEPDRDSGWPKVPVDRLTVKNGGLGLIRDDRPSALDLRYWHEPTNPGKGFVLLDLFTGETT